MSATLAVHFFAPLETVFGLGDEVLGPAVAQTQAEPPKLFGERSRKEIIAHRSVAGQWIPLVNEDLAEAGRGIEFVCEIVYPLDCIIPKITPVLGRRMLVVDRG